MLPSPPLLTITQYRDERNHREEPIAIGSDVWIGAHAVIMPGITIGNGAVSAQSSHQLATSPPATSLSASGESRGLRPPETFQTGVTASAATKSE